MRTKAPPRLLVVEDNETNMMIFRDLLVSEGYLVREAVSAEAAFAIARSEPLDLIVMDVQLPGMDGLEAVRVLKSDPSTCEIPIVAVSAHALPPHQDRALDAGCLGYVTKPIRAREFRERIRGYLGASGCGAEGV